MPGDHARIGPSQLSRLLNCSGSFLLSEGLPEDRRDITSIYAAEGTVAHKIAEDKLRGRNPPGAGDVVTVSGHAITVTADMLWDVQDYVDECRRIIALGRRSRGTFYKWIEKRVNLDWLWGGSPPEPIWGTADFAAFDAATDTFHLRDLKYGTMSVSPVENPQLMAYGLGVAGLMPSVPETARVDLGIVQPRSGKTSVKTWQLPYSALRHWGDTVLKPAVDAMLDAGSLSLKTGAWCRFCPVLPECPLHRVRGRERAKTQFQPVEYEK